MASRNAIELAEQLLALKPSAGQSAVEGVMGGGHMGGCGAHYGGWPEDIKSFYENNRTPVLVVGAILGAAIIGGAGYMIYKKWIWEPAPLQRTAQEDQ